MKKVLFVWSILLLAYSTSVWPLNPREPFVGRQKLSSYSGPLAPNYRNRKSLGLFGVSDSVYNRHYFDIHTSRELYNFIYFWSYEFLTQARCSDSQFVQSKEYIRYLFRLLAISYSFELLKIYHLDLYRLGLKNESCSLNWDQSFSKCLGQTDDMKTFLKRIRYRHMKKVKISAYKRFSKKAKKKWYLSFLKRVQSGKRGIFDIGVSWPKRGLQMSFKKGLNTIQSAVNQNCTAVKKSIAELCSEKDRYYGFSKITALKWLVKQSNATVLINQSGSAEGCIDRFVQFYQTREQNVGLFKRAFSLVFRELMLLGHPYPQGYLFLYGSLKEFDQKGVPDFFMDVKKVAKNAPKERKKLKKILPKKAPPKVVYARPAPVIKAVKKVKKKGKKRSQFYLAYLRYRKKKFKRTAVNMALFQNDFIFSPSMRKKLDKPLKLFQTRLALTDMKKFDQLGSRKTPIQLLFLKYLIDHNYHQGLYNIMAVIGKSFYVRNDIDRQKRPVYIEIKNDESTHFRWNIIIKRPPKKKKIKKQVSTKKLNKK